MVVLKTSGRRLLVALLFLFFVVFSAAVPTSKFLEAAKDELSVHKFHNQEPRMDMEIADYPGTGANHDHDPPTPRSEKVEVADPEGNEKESLNMEISIDYAGPRRHRHHDPNDPPPPPNDPPPSHADGYIIKD
ncbi:Uncharacterized protein Fot_52210 [Forsythia ovata]|uniref:Uncharacterized protein n=1 Tax=Forsythia ovata TaxID=205694 RepID=A0ABD1PK16_9LAMI